MSLADKLTMTMSMGPCAKLRLGGLTDALAEESSSEGDRGIGHHPHAINSARRTINRESRETVSSMIGLPYREQAFLDNGITPRLTMTVPNMLH